MSSYSTSGDLMLEDINTGEKFILPHNKSMFTCGRKKTNEIVTSSILASREHCIFLRVGTQLNVIDPKSANGIFINGVIQQPKTMVTLKVNDIIGLGCSDVTPTSRSGPTNHAVYMLKLFTQPPVNDETEDTNMGLPQWPLDETVKPVIENKRRPSRDSLDCQVPSKIPKIEERPLILVTQKKNLSESLSHSGILSKSAKVSPLSDIIDITDDNNSDEEMKIIESSNSFRSDPRKILHCQRAILVNQKHPESEVTSNSTVMSSALLMDDEEMSVNANTFTKFRTSDIKKVLERDKNQCRASVISIAINRSFEKKHDNVQCKTQIEEATFNIDAVSKRDRSIKGKSRREEVPAVLSGLPISREKDPIEASVTSRHKDQITFVAGQSEDSLSADDNEILTHLLLNLQDEKSNADGEHEHFSAGSLNLDELNLHDRMLSDNCEVEIVANKQILTHANDNGIDQWIKYEPELNILDDNEFVYMDMNDSSYAPVRTPMKLKRDKQQPKTRFSELDVVTLSDDEDEFFFPASQLFGDEPGHEGAIKIEAGNGDSAEHAKDAVEDDPNDYPDIIVLSDSEDEADQWYDRLMGSQLEESRQFYINSMVIKREPEKINFVEGEQDFAIKDVAKDLNRETYHLCLGDDGETTEEAISGKSNEINKRKQRKSLGKVHEHVEGLEMGVEEPENHLVELEMHRERPNKPVEELQNYIKESKKPTNEPKKQLEDRETHTEQSEKHVEVREKRIAELTSSKILHKDRKTEEIYEEKTGKSNRTGESMEKKSHNSKRSKHLPIKKSTNEVCDIKGVKAKEFGHKAKDESHEKLETSGDAKTAKILDPSNQRRDSVDRKSSGSINLERVPVHRSQAIEKGNPRMIETATTPTIGDKHSPVIDKAKSRLTDKENSRPIDKENPIIILTKLDYMRKSLQLVDLPFLGKDQGRGVSCTVKRIDTSTDGYSTTSVQQTSQTNVTLPTKTVKNQSEPILITKHRKEVSLKTKQEEHLRMKEQKLRRMKNKWADCLPPRKKKAGTSLTREEIVEIKNDRKEKLKKIADEKKGAAESNDVTHVKRPITKAKAKVTEKSRNDFLVNEMQYRNEKQSINSERSFFPNGIKPSEASRQTPKSSTVMRNTFVNGELPPKMDYDKSSDGTRKKEESLNMNIASCENDKTSVDNSSTMKQVAKQLKSSVVINPNTDESVRRKVFEKSTNATVNLTKTQKGLAVVLSEPKLVAEPWSMNDYLATESLNVIRDPRTKAGQTLKSSLKKKSLTVTNKDRRAAVTTKVSFNDLMTKVQFYEIDPGNAMKKCPTTDAPVLAKKRVTPGKAERAACPQLEQFLLNIFCWNPAWLQEQKQLGTMPPVVDEKKLIPMLSKYGSYEDYYNVMEPLLALELWYGITKDFNASEKHSKTPLLSSIVNNSIGLTTITSLQREVRVTTLLLEVVVSKRDSDSNAHPVLGDLILFTYVSNGKGKQNFCTIFAYVTSLKQTIITPFTHFNRDLVKCVKEPYAVLTYTVMTKPLDPTNIQTNRAHRVRKISYLRSNMRMIQALQYLPISPLLNQILTPKSEDYQLPAIKTTDSHPLITKDRLNMKQLEAVIRITNTVLQKLPKISLIHGPPGTGKTKVIVNLVTEILYGGGRYQNKKMRILICAPSNAAIDEIVLRLLKVRKAITGKDNRFKMVRIGRSETMHPTARHVSLQELAKREVKRTTENYLSPTLSSDSIKEERNFLEARINALQLELTSARHTGAIHTSYIMRKLSDINAKYDLLMNRRKVETTEPKELSKLQRGAENTLLAGADVIACTLTSCYTNLMETTFGGCGETISVCIVDEATQCAEAETLIPLMLGTRTLVLVGDTNQLPATIISQKAKQYGLDQSLFARIQRSFTGQEMNPIILLDTQYRMSYPVAFWPNRFFYAGALRNAANLRNLPFHFYKVINLDSTQDADKFSNTDEATFVANLYYTMMARSKLDDANLPVKVGIITPYNNQKALITKKIRDRIAPLPDKAKKRFIYEVNTVDSFQGQERDLIIMSCVRSNGIGFLSDQQRLCVALTRAKHSLILCGNFKTFERDPMWHALLSDALSRGVHVNVKATASPEEIMPLVVR